MSIFAPSKNNTAVQQQKLPWIQLPAKNLKRAAAFYHKVFDMPTFFETLNDIPHAVFIANDNGLKYVHGAIIELPEEEAIGRGPVLFFEVTGKFESCLDAIVEMGGEVLVSKTLIKAKQEDGTASIPNTYIDDQPGYFARIIDSEGNRIGLYGAH